MQVGDLYIDNEQELIRNFYDLYMYRQGYLTLPDIESAPLHLLAWTTTPWTLPANMFAAVHEDINYVQVYDPAEKEFYVLAESLLGNFYKNVEDRIVYYRFTGKELI